MACTLKHALVTGASSGIGRSAALRLAGEGYHVFATVRAEPDGAALQDQAGGGPLTPLLMDVVKDEEIKRAASKVAEHTGGRLDALINNAGIGVFEPLETIALERFRYQLDVNVCGQLSITQAFLPMLRRVSGSVVMIGSIAGRITMPFAGPQSSAKHAVVGMTDAFRQELAPWGIRVILVEPASIRSAAIDKLARDATGTRERLGDTGDALYGETFERTVDRALALTRQGSDPDVVADVIVRALRSRHPRARYRAGKHAARLTVLSKLPPFLLDALRRRLFGLPAPDSANPTHNGKEEPWSTYPAARSPK